MRLLRTTFFQWLACAVLLAGAGGWAAAQEVDVATVKFTNLRAPNGGPGNWLEADIALNVRPAPGSPGLMVSRVRVSLLVGCELPALAGGEHRTEYYRAWAECVALEAGRADVRFYLPPEIVKRDQLHGDPKYWQVEVIVGGRAQTMGRAGSSPALATAEARSNFLARNSAAAAPNDGLLLPQYLTPFAGEYPRATPSFVRREPR